MEVDLVDGGVEVVVDPVAVVVPEPCFSPSQRDGFYSTPDP